MLNEKSDIWIKLHKFFIVVLFFICCLGGFVLSSVFHLIGWKYFCCIGLGVFAGLLQWSLNMLFLNLVSNLQALRLLLEKKEQFRETWAEKRVLKPIK